MPEDHVYVFLHLPKTGGTTINGHLKHHMVWDEEIVHLAGWGDRYRREAGRLPVAERSPEERSRIRVITGHDAFYGIHELVPGRTPRYLFLSREPADRLASIYNFRAARTQVPDFWTWYRDQPVNPAFRWLRRRIPDARSFDDVAETLRGFWFVGATEHLGEDLPRLFANLGVPVTWVDRRVAGRAGDLGGLDHPDEDRIVDRRVTVDDEMRARIRRENRRDARLHNLALRRRTRTRWDR